MNECSRYWITLKDLFRNGERCSKFFGSYHIAKIMI